MTRRYLPLVAGLTLLLGACAPVVTNVPMAVEGQPASEGSASMVIVEDANGAKATAYLDGKAYQGRLVQESQQVSTPVQNVEIIKNADGSESQVVTQSYETRTQYSATANGMLIAGTGEIMRCVFTLAYPEWGFSQGGIADCTLTDGRKVVASF